MYGMMKLMMVVVLAVASPVLAQDAAFHQTFADQIGKAHGADAYRSHAALQADVTVSFGGKAMLKGVMTFDTPVGKSRIETADGTVMVFDGQDAYVTPADAPIPPGMARFHLLTWPYFIAAPFKLADPGTHIDDAGIKPIDVHHIFPTGKLTFTPGTGDSPDDWYLVYRDPDTNQLAAMAYIVTYGKDTHDAEKEPHIAIYEAFEEVDGVTLPTRMSMWNWETGTGKIGEMLGQLELANYQFVEPDESTFTQPDGARIDAPPPPANQG